MRYTKIYDVLDMKYISTVSVLAWHKESWVLTPISSGSQSITGSSEHLLVVSSTTQEAQKKDNNKKDILN